MYAKGGKGSAVPSDSQAREKLALYVYEYLLHVGAQKSAQTFLSEIRWEKNITLGEPPGFLHSWWCVFWDLYCAAPDRREACEHSSEAKAFQDYPPVGLPSSQPLLPGTMEPSPRAQGHSSMGPMQRVTPPRGMTSIGPQVRAGPGDWEHQGLPPTKPALTAPLPSQSYGGGGMRPPPNSLAGPGLPTMNMGPGVRGPWASPSGNSIPYSSSSPGSYSGPPGGGGPPGTPIMPSPGDSTNSSENMYTIMNPIGPGAGRANFPLGPGPEGPMAAMSAMEPHHVNGSLGSGDLDGLPKSSPGAVAGLSNTPGTPRDDGEMAAAGTFLHPFPSESYSPGMTMSV
ncbi:single-stranded DNA-binding protein 4 isoform X13 [Capricornis sumatraensis]|uniref:single-stranded DNA-binding protein 4 isoform X13 n=1 Tax=Capricornis sumatraensis TaxID=34865 RepID=UPI0036052B45